jgi:hypothetical protein
VRYRVWINDSAGIHTPSHPIGERRAAEVFAANRSRFRRDCFVIVVRDGDPQKRWVVAYRGGFLQDTQVQNAFKPQPVIIRDVLFGTTFYGLIEETESRTS